MPKNSIPGTDRFIRINSKEFALFSEFIQNCYGIKMPESKKILLESRLQERLRSLEMDSFDVYYQHLCTPEGKRHELSQMVNVITTNKTDFFRESLHFDHLSDKILPELSKSRAKPLKLWSAGCSTGEEPFTLAMVLCEFSRACPGLRFSIFATDISTRVLQKAMLAIYEEEQVYPIPQELQKRYLLRSRNRSKGLVRIVPELRDLVQFQQLNLMDSTFDINEPIDIIFCRNVIIYFNKENQEKLIMKFCRHLAPGGYLFLGHSETLSGMDVPLVPAGPTLYRKPIK